MPLTKIDDRGLKTPIDLLDNEKIRLGTGNDLEIYHNGSQNYINTSNGSLELRHTVSGANEPMIKAFPNGQVQLMYNSSTKLDTTNTGISVTGEIVASGGVNFGGGKASINVNSNVMDFVDNFALRLGNSQDLAIYHNGNHSKIRDEGTGNLYIESDNGNIYLRVNDNEQAVTAVQNGAVELYHDNAKKFETTVNGITVSGDAFLADNNKFLAGTSNDLQIYHDGTHSYLYNLTGELKNRAAVWKAVNAANSEKMIVATENSSVELYHNNDKKLETSSIGVNIFGDTTVGVNNNTQANLHFTSPSDNASARYSRIRKNYNSPFNMEYFASTSSSAQNHVFYSNLTTEVARIQGAGGISFNGDTAAANALDDYEEGTFTPSFQFDQQAFNGSYSAQGGYYTKIGRQVFISMQISATKGTNTAGGAIITGLPFTVLNQDNARSSGSVGYYEGFSDDKPILILVEQNQTQFPLRHSANTNATSFGQAGVGSSFRIYITLSYFTG